MFDVSAIDFLETFVFGNHHASNNFPKAIFFIKRKKIYDPRCPHINDPEVVVEPPQPTPSKTVDEPTPSLTPSPTASTATLTVDATSGDLLIHVDHANGYSNGLSVRPDRN